MTGAPLLFCNFIKDKAAVNIILRTKGPSGKVSIDSLILFTIWQSRHYFRLSMKFILIFIITDCLKPLTYFFRYYPYL